MEYIIIVIFFFFFICVNKYTLSKNKGEGWKESTSPHGWLQMS